MPLPDLAVILIGIAVFGALAVFVLDTVSQIVRTEREDIT
jgi:hypothetical protein